MNLFLSVFLTLFNSSDNQVDFNLKNIGKNHIVLSITNNSDSTCYVANMSNSRVKNYILLDILGLGNLVFYLYPSNAESDITKELNIFMGYIAVNPFENIRIYYKVKDIKGLNKIRIEYAFHNPELNRKNIKLKTVNVFSKSSEH
jgi:hypothetical protein